MPDLFTLIEEGNVEEVESCLEKSPISVNDYNKHGYTPLSVAVQKTNINMVKRLLHHGADVNARSTAAAGTYQGYTPMHFAAKTNEPTLLDLLAASGASPKLVGKDGWTPLHVACFSNCLQSIKWLLAKKVDVNALDENRVPPIVSIVSHGRMEALRMLVKAGAKLTVRDAAGDTLFHHALHTTMHKLFENSYTLPEVQLDAACMLAICGLDPDVTNRDGIKATAYIEKEFGSDTFCKVLKLLYLNAESLRKAEGDITEYWNYMTLLSVKTRQVFEQIGIHGQQAKDLVDLLHAFDKERRDRNDPAKKKSGYQPRKRKQPVAPKKPTPQQEAENTNTESDSDGAAPPSKARPADGPQGGSEARQDQGATKPDILSSTQAKAEAPTAKLAKLNGVHTPHEDNVDYPASGAANARRNNAATRDAPAVGKNTSANLGTDLLANDNDSGRQYYDAAAAQASNVVYHHVPTQAQVQVVESKKVIEKIVDVRWQHPDAIPPPRLDLAWAYANRTSILCCVISFLLGHILSHSIAPCR